MGPGAEAFVLTGIEIEATEETGAGGAGESGTGTAAREGAGVEVEAGER